MTDTVLTQSAQTSVPLVEIKIWLLRAGLDQPELARRLGISKQYLGDILRGKRKAIHIRARLVQEFGFPEQLIQLSEAA